MKTNLSLLTLGVVLLTFLFFSTVVPLFTSAGPYERHFKDHLSTPLIGADLAFALRAARRWWEGERVYDQLPNRYDYPPQGLVMIAPLAYLEHLVAYRVYLTFGVVALTAIFLLIARQLGTGSQPVSALVFLSLLLISQPGLYLLERGNLDLLGALFTFGGLAFCLRSRSTPSGICLALASCLKVFYLPLLLVALAVPRPRRFLLAYLATHVGMLSLASSINGSALLGWEYLRWLGEVSGTIQSYWGSTNISLPSLLAVIAHVCGRPDLIPLILTTQVSAIILVVLGLLAILGLRRSTSVSPSTSNEQRLAFLGSLVYVTVLWQFVSSAYCLVVLLPLIPIADRLYEAEPDKRVRQLLVAHAILLGLAFAPHEYRVPLTQSFKGHYVVLAGFAWLAVLWRRRPA